MTWCSLSSPESRHCQGTQATWGELWWKYMSYDENIWALMKIYRLWWKYMGYDENIYEIWWKNIADDVDKKTLPRKFKRWWGWSKNQEGVGVSVLDSLSFNYNCFLENTFCANYCTYVSSIHWDFLMVDFFAFRRSIFFCIGVLKYFVAKSSSRAHYVKEKRIIIEIIPIW